MAAQQGKSGLAGKLATNVDSSIKEAMKNAPSSGGIIAMPGGVKQGVARLAKIGFYEYKPDTKQKKANGQSAAGEYFFRAVGIAIEPKDTIDPITNNRARVAGLQTSIMINCFDTKGSGKDAKVVTQAENMVKVVDAMRLLAGDKYMAGANKFNLEQLAAGIQKVSAAKPIYFMFSTSVSDQGQINPRTGKPYPPRVFENWHGIEGLENYAPPSAAGMVSAEDLPEPTGDDHEPSGEHEQEHSPAETGPEDSGPSEDGPGTDTPDLEALAARADVNPPTKDSKAAAEELKAFALKIGLDESTVDNADNWAQVVEMISNFDPAGVAEAAPQEEAAAEVWVPSKGEVVQYARPGVSAATKKPFKPFDCEVVDVSAKKSTVKLKSKVDNKTIYENVPFDQVSAKS